MHQPRIEARISENGAVKDARAFMQEFKNSHVRGELQAPETTDDQDTILGLVSHIERMQHYFNTLAFLTGNDPEEAIDIVEEHLRSEKGWT